MRLPLVTPIKLLIQHFMSPFCSHLERLSLPVPAFPRHPMPAIGGISHPLSSPDWPRGARASSWHSFAPLWVRREESEREERENLPASHPSEGNKLSTEEFFLCPLSLHSPLKPICRFSKQNPPSQEVRKAAKLNLPKQQWGLGRGKEQDPYPGY